MFRVNMSLLMLIIGLIDLEFVVANGKQSSYLHSKCQCDSEKSF